jgi:hypothetical protein
VAFGSGFKCNSGVWLCLNNNKSHLTKTNNDSATATAVEVANGKNKTADKKQQ